MLLTKISGKITYRYTMGFAVDGNPIPDPASGSGKISDLDTLGKRDVTGMIHRSMVSTKRKVDFEYRNIEWEMIQYIADQFRGKDKFTFRYMDPLDGEVSITAYVGDRDWEHVWSPENDTWIGSLKFNVIEY